MSLLIGELYGDSCKDGWLATQKKYRFGAWCEMFHDSHHEEKHGKHRCTKCGKVAYTGVLATSVKNLNT